MGQRQSISTTCEIKAPPETVRSIFLDFRRYSEWAKGIEIKTNDEKTAGNLEANKDYLNVKVNGTGFKPQFLENSPTTFKWLGSLPGIFTGAHEFHFSPSKTTAGGTTFVQAENFSGLFAFLMGEGWSMRKGTISTWEQFNASLKAEAEKNAGS